MLFAITVLVLYFQNDFMQTKMNKYDAEGRKHGPWIEYRFNGKVWAKCEYIHGKQHGPWIEYYNNGQIYITGEYIHGRAHGSWMMLHNNGKLCYKQTFDMDKRIGYFVHYNIFGILITKHFYAR